MVKRNLPLQIQTRLPARDTLEVCWRAFENYGIQNTVIDAERKIVQGIKGKSLLSYGRTYTAQLKESLDGLVISLRIEEWEQDGIDFGGRNEQELARIGKQVTDELRLVEANGRLNFITTPNHAPPIAYPKSTPPLLKNPVYGKIPFHQNGIAALTIGLIALVFCCIAPFCLMSEIKMLRSYEKQPNDPHWVSLLDWWLIIIGTVLSGVGVVLLLFSTWGLLLNSHL